MLKAIAVDDEPLALEVIENYCGRIDLVSLERTFIHPNEALKYLNKFQVDLVLVDINMSALNGMELAKSLKQSTRVIFTTAYTEFAVQAFEINAIDYLVKPFSFDRFKTAVEKVRITNTSPVQTDHFFIRANYKLHKIVFTDLLLIEGLDDYVRLHLENNEKITARISMKELLKRLPENLFIRVHRSYIIPVSRIGSIQNNTIRVGEFVIPIGKNYKPELSRFL